MNQEQILIKAKEICWDLRKNLHPEREDGEIKLMEEHEHWVSANKDSLPTVFLENWRWVRETLEDSVRKDKQAHNTPDGPDKKLILDEVRKLRYCCWNVLKETGSEIQQELDSLN